MADAVVQPAKQRYALITGANKGIGFEICRKLASRGMVVILAARDERRGIEARERLKEFDNVVFHQLDVADPASVAAVFEFIKSRFGRLDILAEPFRPKAEGKLVETWKGAEECMETNYYGAKRVTKALIPLLQLSDSPRIVNVSSMLGCLVLQPNEWVKGLLISKEGLSEERVDEVVQEFINDLKENKVEEKQWPPHLAAYKVSKAALNAYTWVAAQQHPCFLINAVCPGFARTDITYNHGQLSEAAAAEAPVKMALLPDGGPSGNFFHRLEALSL